jgi:hypothetical protein
VTHPVPARRRRRPVLRDRAFAVAFLAGATALLTWPFLRVPPLPLVGAFLHLLGAWALLLLGLWRMARALATPRAAPGEEDDGA